MAKDKKSNFRLMGFGHRVYKNFDPRAKILKAAADKILAKMQVTSRTRAVATQNGNCAVWRHGRKAALILVPLHDKLFGGDVTCSAHGSVGKHD